MYCIFKLPYAFSSHRIPEYAELEAPHKDHQVQDLALHRTFSKSHTMLLGALSSTPVLLRVLSNISWTLQHDRTIHHNRAVTVQVAEFFCFESKKKIQPMSLPDFCSSSPTDRAGNYNLICFQNLTEVQLRHWHSWVLGKREGQRNNSYLRSFAKGGQKRSLTVCKGLSFLEIKTQCRSVLRKAEIGQRHLTNWLARDTEPWRAEPCNTPSPPLNSTKTSCQEHADLQWTPAA